QTWFIRQVPNLELDDSNLFFLKDVGTFKAGASHSQEEFDNYRTQSGFDSPFRSALEAAITVPGLTVDNILNRATALSSAACHEQTNTPETADSGNGLLGDPSLGFVHNSETFTVEGPFGTRFPLSDNLRFVLLPHRADVMANFLAEVNCEPCNPVKAKQFGPP